MEISGAWEREGILSRVTTITFLCLIASLGFIQTPYYVLGQPIVLTDLIFLMSAILWLCAVITKQRILVWHQFYWFLIFYAAALLVSCPFSADPITSFERLPAEAYLIALCVLTINLVRSEAEVKTSLIAWLAGSGFAVMIGIATITLFYLSPGNFLLEFTTYHFGAVPVGNYPRITSTFASASMLCNYLNVSLLIVLLSKAKRWISDTVIAPLIAGILICSAFTISIGLGGVFLGCGIWFWYNSKITSVRLLALSTGILAAFAFLIVSLIALEPYPGAPIFGPITFSGRVLVWMDAFRTFRQNILTGHGLGLPVANVLFKNTEGGVSLLTDAHNSFLSVAAQSGILALAAIVMISGAVIRRWLAAQNAPITFALGTAFLCSFVYQGLTGSFEEARHLWVLMGLFIAAEGTEKDLADQNS